MRRCCFVTSVALRRYMQTLIVLEVMFLSRYGCGNGDTTHMWANSPHLWMYLCCFGFDAKGRSGITYVLCSIYMFDRLFNPYMLIRFLAIN